MASPTALPLIHYHASLVAPAWGPYPDALELDGEFLRVRRLDIREELGAPWSMTVEVMTNHPQFHPGRMAGSELVLHMLREDAANPAENDGRFFHGVVVASEYIGAFTEAHHLRLDVRAALALLSQTRRSRVFQDRSVVEIAREVAESTLERRGGELDTTRLSGDYPLRDYCVQYEETDLEFVRRILAEEGIVAAFEADESHERTVLLDDVDQFGSILRSVEGLAEPLPHQHLPVHGDALAGVETIATFAWHHRVVPSHYDVEQWAWKQAAPAQMNATATVEEPSARHIGSFYEHGGRRLQEDAGGDGPHLDNSADRIARQYDRSTLEAGLFSGSSNALGMVPGGTFELDGHPEVELNGPYACLRVTHTADNAAVELGAAGHGTFDNHFVCAPLDVAFAPASLPRPRIFGVQTAVVVGPAGEEIHTDVHGRVKVRMHWDREQRDRDDDTSCWLRVAQAWAGAGFGTQFIPRVGMEVLVSFLGGDPDRPVCVGAVYNGRHPPPYTLPDNKTQSGIRTQSSPGGDGFNELRFEDAAGQEEVYFHAQRDHNERVERVHTKSVGSSQSVSVGAEQTVSVGGVRTVNVTGDQSITVGAPPPPDGSPAAGPSNHALTVEGDIIVTSNQKTITLTSPQSISLICGGSSLVLTPGAITLVAGGGTQLAMSAGLAMATANAGVAVDMNDVGTMDVKSAMGSALKMDGEIHLESAGQTVVDLTDTLHAHSSAGAKLDLDADVGVQGGTVVAQAASAKLELGRGIEGSGTDVKLAASASKLELTAASAKLSSAVVDVAGMGMVNIGAPNVKIN